MKSKGNNVTLIECNDPMLYLAAAIVYSGVTACDDNFFRSNWARVIFDGLGIDTDPWPWYKAVIDRKERAKHGNRCSKGPCNP